jgi:uncharacterized membrane protein SpoIIM required for sporulation
MRNFYDLRMTLLVTRREVRDSFRDWRIIFPIIILTLVFPALATFTARMLLRFTEQFGAELIGDRLIPFLLLIVGFFPMSFSLVIALETFVGEKERKSLEPLLATPLTNRQLYFGKVLASIIPPLMTSYLGIAVYLTGLIVAVGWNISSGLMTQILLISTIQGVIMVAAAVIVSSQTTSVRAANLLASFIIVPIALLLQFEAIVLFWGNSVGLWWLILALAITAAILVRMGVKIFNREELLGQDIDQLKLMWIWKLLWEKFAGRDADGRYPAPWTWYKRMLSAIPNLTQPSIVLLIALAGGLVLGAFLTRVYALPPELQFTIKDSDIATNIVNLREYSSQLPLVIFMQNTRIILIIAVLGIFTIGVTDVMIFMLPGVLIGYLGGLLLGAGQDPLKFVLATIVPHAIIELPALLIAAAAALRWHSSVLSPPPKSTISENWLNTAADFGRLVVGLVIPLLFLGALVEAFITPIIVIWAYGG